MRELSRLSREGDAVAAQKGSITQLKTVERGLPPRSTFWRMTSGQKLLQIGRKIRMLHTPTTMNPIYTNIVYTLIKEQKSMHFTTAICKATFAVHSVGVTFWNPTDFHTLCVMRVGQKNQEFRHSEDVLLTPEAARQIWNTLIECKGWFRQ